VERWKAMAAARVCVAERRLPRLEFERSSAAAEFGGGKQKLLVVVGGCISGSCGWAGAAYQLPFKYFTDQEQSYDCLIQML
jgi:hypothetical protein